MRSKRLLALPCMLILCGTATRFAAAQGDDAARVGAILIEADRLPIDKAWNYLARLRDLDSMSEDAMLSALQSTGDKVGPVGRLLVARSLLDLGDDGLYGAKAVDFAKPILVDKGASAEIRLAAAALLGDRTLVGAASANASEALETVVTDDTADPALRLESAKSLFRVGNTRSRRTAKTTIQSFLMSRERDLQVNGALALYEIGDGFQGGARAILEELQSQPTPTGRLARAYLESEKKSGDLERLERLLANQRMSALRRGDAGTSDDDFKVLRELRRLIDTAWIDKSKLEDDALVESAARGMLEGLDKFSSYLSSDQYARFAFDLNRHYGGIGAFVRVENDMFMITRPIYSGPAYKAGLLSGDFILKVDGWETTSQDQDEIIRRLKGVPGTDVELEVMRNGWPEPQNVKLARAEISVPSVNAEMLPGDIGYAELITFASDTSEELRHQLETMRQKGAKACIIDLRSNTGGYLRQAQGVAELFLPRDKLIVYTKSSLGPEEKFFSSGDAIFPDLPLVVLV
ncbi:MAG: PDZ domain-containing protein, partial [Planctomycetes bacterium]|nr:PDZ domain-containing protein [Planctomycetota bacterium]